MKRIISIILLMALASVPTVAFPGSEPSAVIIVSKRSVYGFTATGEALNVDMTAVHNIKVTQVQINVSEAVVVDEKIYVRRLSSTGDVLAEYSIHPADVSATSFTLVFDKFLLVSGEIVAIDWANTGELDVEAGSNITFEVD